MAHINATDLRWSVVIGVMCFFKAVDLGYGMYNYGSDYWYYSTAIYDLLEGFLSKVEVDSPRYFDTDDIYSYTIRYADPEECRRIIDSNDSVEDRERRMMTHAIRSKLTYRMRGYVRATI